MAYRFVPFPVTLEDFEDHSPDARLVIKLQQRILALN